MNYQGVKKNRTRGFTLLELLVVMFILTMLAGVVTVVVIKRVDEAKHTKAKADIATLATALGLYRLDNSMYPSTLEALSLKPAGEELPAWNGPYIEKPVAEDPWGVPYYYVAPGEVNPDSYDLYTLGRDGREGGNGVDADITNW